MADMLRLRRMLDVERQNSNFLRAAILRGGAENLRVSHNLDRSNDEVAQLQVRCNEFWRYLEHAQ